MPTRALSVAAALCAVAAICVACSQNAGFGAPPVPGPPAPAPAPQAVASGVSPAPYGVTSSASPAAASDQVLSIVSATGRYAYDGAESDPVKAPRFIELAYALKNATSKAVTISKVSVASDAGVAVGDLKLSVTVAPGGTSDVALAAFKAKKELQFLKSVTMTFTDDKGRTLAVGSAELPPTDMPYMPLDEKDPKGATCVDGVEISSVQVAGAGLHYEVTFALTNAGSGKVDLDGFSIAPPKSPSLKVNVPLTIPPRTTTGFISIVLPFKGKSLPDGDYSINAVNGSATLAKTSGALL
ncbi:MAG TPA: hypothetical protein VIX35_03600 [Vicinamibacterales bacterium]